MSDPITVRILGAVAASLKQNVKPALSTSESQLQLDAALRALEYVAARHEMLDRNLATLLAAEERDVAALAALMAEHGKTAEAERINGVLRKPVASARSLSDLEARRADLERAISDLAPALVDLATRAKSSRASQLIGSIVAAQAAFVADQDPESQGNNWVFGGQSLLDAEAKKQAAREIDEASLTAYLQAKFPGRSGVAARDVRNIAGGYSKRTVFFTLVADDATPQKLVIRMDLPGPDRTVKDEYPVLKKVFAAGLPVAEPQWLESDPAWFGGAFMVSSQVAGKTGTIEIAADPVLADKLGRELAIFLAKLHAVDFSELYPDAVKKSAGDCLRDEIIKFYDYYRVYAKDTVPQPLIDLCFAWLLDNIPKETMSAKPSLVHTDVGFHNILTDGEKISAVLDWETIHVGDHAEELYYTKSFVAPLMPWEKFLGYYDEAGGKPVPASSKSFYDVWHGTRIPANAAQLRATFEQTMPEALAFALFGYIFARRIELSAANALKDLVK